MFELLVVLTPIAFVDSLSVWPTCIVPMAIALGGARPMLAALSFIAGIVAVYLPFGVALAFGLASAFDVLNRVFQDFWYNPNTLDLWLGVAIGVVMVALGAKIGTARARREAQSAPVELGAGPAFALGAGLTLAGAWGALPYFAAVDHVLRLDLGPSSTVAVLLWYNLVFVAPLVLFASLRPALGERADRIFDAANTFLVKWGKRLLVVALLALGLVITADSIGWLLGSPLLPTGAQG